MQANAVQLKWQPESGDLRLGLPYSLLKELTSEMPRF